MLACLRRVIHGHDLACVEWNSTTKSRYNRVDATRQLTINTEDTNT